jgi:pimeloyl-ACP methyl ester carboxylesterase
MKKMAGAIERRLGDQSPNICLVDWHEAARPSDLHRLNFGWDAGQFLIDVAAIRPQAQEVGDFVALKLARSVLNGEIRRDRPFHLIGHSAGGFVVTRVALLLKQFNIAPSPLHVTILDTPKADTEMVEDLPQAYPGRSDFYVSSSLVIDPTALKASGLRVGTVTGTVPADLREAHRYAYHWFIETIEKRGSGEGFDRSPFSQPGNSP